MAEDSKLTRRKLVGSAAAAGAGAALANAPGALARPRQRRQRHEVDVAIVGAGFAGLTAAIELQRHGKSVVVLEARNRVGGRALNHHLGGGEVSEAGATFVGPTQGHIIALAKRFGVARFPTYDTGDNVYFRDGTRLTYSDKSPTGIVPPDPTIAPDAAKVVTQLDQMSTEVPVDAPWNASMASEWDGQTLETWAKDNSTYSINKNFRRLVAVATRPIFGADPREISFLFTLFYIAASGDERHPGTFERNFSTRNGAQMWRFHGGSQLITQRMANRLGHRVVLGSPVTRIVQRQHHAVVHSARRDVRAKRVIVAVPPTLAGRIHYQPELPTGRDQLTQRMPQGTLIKVAAVYDKPFWREDGLNGTALSLNGPVNATFDDSPPDGRPGVVFGFVGGGAARGFTRMTAAARRAAVIRNFKQFFGPKAGRPREYFETNWTKEQWTRGCPVAVPGPGVLVAHGPALRRPIGRIHWAGTETSTYWNGYMDGAVRSGERAAKEILAEL
ncbi:MAG: flavin monoamine oxidase family protein [Solirubrobacterales bacterium]